MTHWVAGFIWLHLRKYRCIMDYLDVPNASCAFCVYFCGHFYRATFSKKMQKNFRAPIFYGPCILSIISEYLEKRYFHFSNKHASLFRLPSFPFNTLSIQIYHRLWSGSSNPRFRLWFASLTQSNLIRWTFFILIWPN